MSHLNRIKIRYAYLLMLFTHRLPLLILIFNLISPIIHLWYWKQFSIAIILHISQAICSTYYPYPHPKQWVILRKFISNYPPPTIFDQCHFTFANRSAQFIQTNNPFCILCSNSRNVGYDISNYYLTRELNKNIFWIPKILPGLLNIPLVRYLHELFGNACVNHTSLPRIMGKKYNFTLHLDYQPFHRQIQYDERNVLNNQYYSEIFQYILQFGYNIIPMYTFGDERSYYNIPSCRLLRKILINALFIPEYFLKCGQTMLLPLEDTKINIIYGEPLTVERIDNPTPDDIRRLYLTYIESIQRLYIQHQQ